MVIGLADVAVPTFFQSLSLKKPPVETGKSAYFNEAIGISEEFVKYSLVVVTAPLFGLFTPQPQ
jgi:hypothetical protein